MKENDVINKVVSADSALDMLLDDYNNLITEYKKQTSFAKKIKKAVTIKKVDVAIVNVIDSTTKLIVYATLKNILSKNLAKHYNELIQKKLNSYKIMRESVFSVRKSKILEKRGARGKKKEARNIKSTFITSRKSSTKSVTVIEDVL